MRRRHLLRIAGVGFIIISLVGIAGTWPGIFSASRSFNIFQLVLGLMCFGAADLSGEFSKWFVLMTEFLMAVMLVASLGFIGQSIFYIGNVVYLIIALILLFIRSDMPPIIQV